MRKHNEGTYLTMKGPVMILLDLSCCFHSAFMSISSAKQLWRVLHEREYILIVELSTSVRIPLLDKFNYSRLI
jgi:hypothetical protein